MRVNSELKRQKVRDAYKNVLQVLNGFTKENLCQCLNLSLTLFYEIWTQDILVCDEASACPLQGQHYTGKSLNIPRKVNVGERTVFEMVCPYKGSGRNVTTDNFFTTQLR